MATTLSTRPTAPSFTTSSLTRPTRGTWQGRAKSRCIARTVAVLECRSVWRRIHALRTFYGLISLLIRFGAAVFNGSILALSSLSHRTRQRYFSRSYLGFPPVRTALPNKTHFSIAAIQHLGYVPKFITQNVDNLHHAATPSPSLAASTILELHGTLKHVVCVQSPHSYDGSRRGPVDPDLYETLSASHITGPRAAQPKLGNTPVGENYPRGCGFRGSRAAFQDELTRLNPKWAQLANEMQRTGKSPKTNPDGDVDLQGVDYSTFSYPPCPNCGGVLKPAVIFFGESVPDVLRDHSHQMVRDASALLLVGTSLATYSAFRLVKQAVEEGKDVLILNKGPTRADPIVENKIELDSSLVLNATARMLANGREEKDHVLRRLLESGVTITPNQRAMVSS
nr:putative dhs-like nad fad-binding domain-containing protein [Thecaphora frezii]